MRKSILATILVILAAILASCNFVISPPLPTLTPAPTSSPLPTRTPAPMATGTGAATVAVVIAGSVNVHREPDTKSEVVGWVYSDQKVAIVSCDGDYCLLEQPFGYVWRGCISDNPDNLGCEAR
jgi:hypothetical protein